MLLDRYDDSDENFLETNGSGQNSNRNHKSSFLSILTIIAVLLAGYTFSANISLGSNSVIEFGQGIQIASSCDSEINIKPRTVFKNDPTNPGIAFTGVELSNIAESCTGKLFVLKMYGETGTALKVNANTSPHNLKFHFTNGGWVADSDGCLVMQNAISNSADDNRVVADLSMCLTLPNWTEYATLGSKIYRITLESRDNTVKEVNLNYSKGDGRTVGWVFHTDDAGAVNGHFPGMTSFRFLPDTRTTKQFSIYVELTLSEYNSPNTVSSLFTTSTTGGITCSYAGVAQVGANPRSIGMTTGFYTTTLRSAEYVCTLESSGSLAIS